MSKTIWLNAYGGCEAEPDLVAKYCADGIILSKALFVEIDGVNHYPMWQFGDSGLIEGLVDVREQLAKNIHSTWTELKFFVEENDYIVFNSNKEKVRTPLDALLDDNVELAVKAASVYMTHGCS